MHCLFERPLIFQKKIKNWILFITYNDNEYMVFIHRMLLSVWKKYIVIAPFKGALFLPTCENIRYVHHFYWLWVNIICISHKERLRGYYLDLYSCWLQEILEYYTIPENIIEIINNISKEYYLFFIYFSLYSYSLINLVFSLILIVEQQLTILENPNLFLIS